MIMNWLEKFQDLFKREITPTEMEAIFQRLDVDQFFGMLNNLWHPSELINKIGGYHNLPLLYKDSEIYAAVDKRLAALMDTRLVIDGENKELAKFFQDQILPHEQQLKQDFWWAIPYGFAVEQIIYDPNRTCKVIGFQKEDFWRFEPLQDQIHVRVVRTSNTALMNQVMPYGKWVLTTNNGTYSNPYGDPMFERLIQPWIFRCNGWDLWMDFAKRFANGFMHAKISDADKASQVRKELEKAAKASIIVTDKDSELTLIQASRDSSLYSMIDDKTVNTMQRVILGETLSSSMQARGSAGAADIHNEVRLEKTRADIRLVEKSINETIRQIGAVCGYDEESLPKATLIFDPGLNAELAARDSVLTASGVKFTKQYYVNNYGFKEEDFEIKEEAASPFSMFSQTPAKKKGNKQSFLNPEDVKTFLGIPDAKCGTCNKIQLAPNLGRKDARQLEEKEDTVDFLLRNGAEPINMDDLLAAINTATSSADLDEKLAILFDQRNPDFVDLMTDALYYAATKGALLGNPETLEPTE